MIAVLVLGASKPAQAGELFRWASPDNVQQMVRHAKAANEKEIARITALTSAVQLQISVLQQQLQNENIAGSIVSSLNLVFEGLKEVEKKGVPYYNTYVLMSTNWVKIQEQLDEIKQLLRDALEEAKNSSYLDLPLTSAQVSFIREQTEAAYQKIQDYHSLVVAPISGG